MFPPVRQTSRKFEVISRNSHISHATLPFTVWTNFFLHSLVFRCHKQKNENIFGFICDLVVIRLFRMTETKWIKYFFACIPMSRIALYVHINVLCIATHRSFDVSPRTLMNMLILACTLSNDVQTNLHFVFVWWQHFHIYIHRDAAASDTAHKILSKWLAKRHF